MENNLASINKIKKENQSLQHRMTSLLKCEVCDKDFESKDLLVNHIEDHFKQKYEYELSKKFRCKSCDKFFRNKDDLEKHSNVKHKSKLTKELLLQKQTHLLNQIHLQSSQIQKCISKLIRFEVSDNGKCKCKGKCAINHSKHRWTKGTHNKYSLTLETINSSVQKVLRKKYKCNACNLVLLSQNGLNSHMENDHKTYTCNYCDFESRSCQDLSSHIEMNHMKVKPLKSILKNKIW